MTWDRMVSCYSKSSCYYAYSTINAPDKGEVGGSSPPRPTIQITNIYAAILTFPFLGTFIKKPFCQKFAKSSSSHRSRNPGPSDVRLA